MKVMTGMQRIYNAPKTWYGYQSRKQMHCSSKVIPYRNISKVTIL